ncbi:MFS transporter [Streptomyces sp. NPDC056528]|uniref:MFS transporter n=1 Tax=Streptomyces sp. NPDC056528 TaxID=3345854 RepID=UPI00368A0CDE
MKRLWTQTRSFPPIVRLLMVNQFAINFGFSMLMPYLAFHLAGGLGLAASAVGLVLGLRHLSQQGLYLLGGTIVDRVGYKTPILAGCLLRTAGFGMLGWAETLPALISASLATGFASALFNPAVRAYLAAEAGERRVDAFAVFNVYFQGGMLLGPVVGFALLAVDFRLVCVVAAGVFGALAVLQWRALPARRGPAQCGVTAQWRAVAANRSFTLFSLAMAGSSVLTFQTYMLLPLVASETLGSDGPLVTGALFAASAAVAVAAQLRLTAWVKLRWSAQQTLVRGLSLMGLAFVPLTLSPQGTTSVRSGCLAAAAVLLAVASTVIHPFEMDMVVALARGRFVATHYGLYSTVAGVSITGGNLAAGALWDAARHAEHLVWGTLTALGLACAAWVAALGRTGHLPVRPPDTVPVGAPRPRVAGQPDRTA